MQMCLRFTISCLMLLVLAAGDDDGSANEGINLLQLQKSAEFPASSSKIRVASGKPQVERGPRMCYRGYGAALVWPHTAEHLKGPRPPEYDYLIPVVSLCAVLCILILTPVLYYIVHIYWVSAELDQSGNGNGKAGARAQRSWPAIWMGITAASPGVIVMCKLLAVIAPRLWKILFLLATIYEVTAFWCFMKLVFSFVGKDDEEILARFAEAPATRMWAAPPLACCFRPCIRERQPDAGDLRTIRALLTQFLIISPLMAVIECSEKLSHHAHKVVGRIEVLSLLLAMYGLFALIIATHDVLPNHRLHAKFWTVKGSFIASMAIFRIFCEVLSDDVRVGGRCYTREMIAAAQAGTLTAILTVGFSGLASYAFRPEDLDSKKK